MNLKLLMVSALLAFAASAALAQSLGVAIIKADGSTHTVEFESLNRIDISAGTVTVHHATAEPVTHNMADIDRIDIGTDVAGIADITADGSIAVWPTVVTSTINVAGAGNDTSVTVISLAGQQVATAKTVDGKAVIDLSAATPGVYIINVGKHTVKIIKK